MAIIPTNFFQENYQKEAFSLIRLQLSTTGNVKDMIEEIIKFYETANESQRSYLGRYMSMILDFDNGEYAERCANLFGIYRKQGLSVSETIVASINEGEESIYHYNDFSTQILRDTRLFVKFPAANYSGIFSYDVHDHILALSIECGIYLLMHPRGELMILGLENNPQDILIDEEIFEDDTAPLYFTETTHFVSPVFKVNVAYTILQYILKEIGYPAIPVNRKVIFTSPEASLININDFAKEDSMYKWNDVEVLMAKDFRLGSVINKGGCILNIDYEPKSSINLLRSSLITALTATSIIFEDIWNRKLMAKLTPEILAKLCFENYIFLPREF